MWVYKFKFYLSACIYSIFIFFSLLYLFYSISGFSSFQYNGDWSNKMCRFVFVFIITRKWLWKRSIEKSHIKMFKLTKLLLKKWFVFFIIYLLFSEVFDSCVRVKFSRLRTTESKTYRNLLIMFLVHNITFFIIRTTNWLARGLAFKTIFFK